ncbi:MAG TPA: helix-turn-helix domain-containing protein [Flavobacterium sp.]|jgi:hypothetical protein
MKVILDKTERKAFVRDVAKEVLRMLDERNPPPEAKKESILNLPKMYGVNEVHEMTGLAKTTISAHLRLGILQGTKAGKKWIITQESFDKYTGH